MGFQRTYDYSDAPTIRKFNECEKFFRLLQGPFGSGKSSGCVAEIIDRGVTQKPDSEGVRRTRWAVVRSTYPQLNDTTIKTFFDWLPPEHFGNYKSTTHEYTIDKIRLDDGTRVVIEILFRALDKPEHVRNLLSMELTGAWLNESREIPRIIIEAIEGRVGRYPSVENGGCTWYGVICDTNPPDTDSWQYHFFEEKVPNSIELQSKYEIFKQPSGRSDQAENLRYLPPNYYKTMAIGKDPEFVKVYIDGEYGYVRDGKPVFENYSDFLHCAESDIEPIKGIPIILSFDFGMNQAAVISQLTVKSRFNVIREFYEEGIGLRRFLLDIIKPYMMNMYRGMEVVVTGDPMGVRRMDTDERSCFDELRMQGFPVTPAHSNSWLPRFNAVDVFLTKLIEGKPAFQLSPSCQMLRKGFLGEYKLKKFRGTYNHEKYSEVPMKNDFSHLQDALQYGCMMADRGLMVTRGYMGSRYEAPRRSARPTLSAWT